MESKTIEKFQIIGACVKMQTISLEDEIKIIDGILYDINFEQDFSTIYLNGQPITDIPINSIINSLNNPEVKVYNTPIRYTAEDRRRSQEFWKHIDKIDKEKKELEIKWEKGRKKRKKHAKWLFDAIESGRYFVKW